MKSSDLRKLAKPIDHRYSEMFSGRVFRVGEGAVSVRNHSGRAEQSVIGVHGFLGNHCYFTQAYEAPTTELILLTCSRYHIPVNGVTPETPDWAVPIDELEGTIEYDACLLNQALANLPTTSNIRVHGHSRGGAVILEALSRQPELYRNVEVVLEAPILPQGKLHALVITMLEPVSHGMWPWLIRLINSAPSSAYGQIFFGKMNRRKKQLLTQVFSATRDHLTIVRNLENIIEWMQRTDPDIYRHLQQGSFLIPAVDRILDRQAMLASARQCQAAMALVETTAPSHFITLDSRKWVPAFTATPTTAEG